MSLNNFDINLDDLYLLTALGQEHFSSWSVCGAGPWIFEVKDRGKGKFVDYACRVWHYSGWSVSGALSEKESSYLGRDYLVPLRDIYVQLDNKHGYKLKILEVNRVTDHNLKFKVIKYKGSRRSTDIFWLPFLQRWVYYYDGEKRYVHR